MRNFSPSCGRQCLYLTPLDEKIPPSSDEICCIEAGLVLCSHELPLGGQNVSVLHCAYGVVLSDTIMINTPAVKHMSVDSAIDSTSQRGQG